MSSTLVHLTGGLGNQLFQIAAAKSKSSKGILVEQDLGEPRLNRKSEPDFTDFTFPFEIEIHKIGQSLIPRKLITKTVGFILRQGLSQDRFNRNRHIRKLSKVLASILSTMAFRKPISVVQATDNGYCELTKTSLDQYLIGYFQSYRWEESLNKANSLRNLELKEKSPHLEAFIEQFKKIETVMVHVRLGDYKQEPHFGIPTQDYYANALATIFRDRHPEVIVLFSNEPDEALTFIPTEFRNLVVVAPDFMGSASETLEAMRYMKNFIIGNSSLSWWGAYLSRAENCKVICPSPWFRSSPEPNKLIPGNWERLKGWPQDEKN